MYWQGDLASDSPATNFAPTKPTGRVSSSSILHELKQPILGLGLTPLSANTLLEIGDNFKNGCAIIPHGLIKLKASAVNIAKAQVLGEGGTSKVYRGVYQSRNVAVKMAVFVTIDQQVIRQVVHEANLCALLRHENIVEFLGVSIIPPSVALVYELCEGGSLDVYLSKNWSFMTVTQKLLMCLDCAMGLEFLHIFGEAGRGARKGKAFSHGDIKSMNFLVAGDGKVKMCDLATACPQARLASVTDRLQLSAAQQDCSISGEGSSELQVESEEHALSGKERQGADSITDNLKAGDRELGSGLNAKAAFAMGQGSNEKPSLTLIGRAFSGSDAVNRSPRAGGVLSRIQAMFSGVETVADKHTLQGDAGQLNATLRR
jgi:hypothetical protein